VYRSFFAVLLLLPLTLWAEEAREGWEELHRNDAPLEHALAHPDWFKVSFLDLGDDLRDANRSGKNGLIVYFGQEHCPYCEKLMTVNWGKRDMTAYTRRHFDVIAVDIHGDRTVTLFDGDQISEKAWAVRENTNFTPSLIFYDEQGNEALRLRGYHPPYEFRAALEYVADDHYEKESFRAFLDRAEPPLTFELHGLADAEFFMAPPYALNRSFINGERPLVVFFEQGDCHACDLLHSGPLENNDIVERLERFDTVQLDMWGDNPVITPDGERLTARDWAEKLQLFYTPTLLFFDRQGNEILRVDSVAGFYRLRGALDYVLSGAYRDGLTLPRWYRDRQRQR